MTCWCCGLWLALDDDDQPPAYCRGCGEPTAGRDEDDQHGGCGDDECAFHDGHCLIEGERYRPDECDYCRSLS